MRYALMAAAAAWFAAAGALAQGSLETVVTFDRATPPGNIAVAQAYLADISAPDTPSIAAW